MRKGLRPDIGAVVGLLVAMVGCGERPLVVILTVEDPAMLGANAQALLLRHVDVDAGSDFALQPDAPAQRRALAGKDFPVTITLTAVTPRTAALGVEAVGGGEEQVLGRGWTRVRFERGRDGTALVQLGRPCDAETDCGAAWGCSEHRVCVQRLPAGAVGCSEGAACATGYCDASPVGPETGRCCVEGGSWLAAGGGGPVECCDGDSDCPAGGRCVQQIDGAGYFACTTGQEGQPCDDDGHCAAEHFCRESDDRCTSGQAGAACDDTADCRTDLACLLNKRCEAPLPQGGYGCRDSAGCETGGCDLSPAGPEIGRCCGEIQCCDADSDCAGSTPYCLASRWACTSVVSQ